jgi:hypothetical protein
MKIYDVSLADLERIAENIRAPKTGISFQGSDISNGAGYRVQGALKPKSGYVNPYPRTSASYFYEGRRIAAICWHGYRDYLRAVFTEFPNARIVTVFADYRGLEGFENLYPDTAFTPLGAPIAGGYPLACQACECPDSGLEY